MFKRNLFALLASLFLLASTAHGAPDRRSVHPLETHRPGLVDVVSGWAHRALAILGLEKDGAGPTPLSWPPLTTQDGGSCADPNGCLPPKP
jgi:hypothetical protein